LDLKKTIKTALIGTGYWGRNILRVGMECAEIEIISITDLQSNNFSTITSQYPGIRTFTDYKKAIDDNRVDAVIIVTPVSTHFEIVQYALKKGKHVLCEKVLCTDVAEEKALWQLANAQGKILMVDFTFLFNSAVRYIKSAITQKAFGRIYNITMKRLGHGPIRKDVDVITDLVTHDLSILHYWLGKPRWVNAHRQSLLGKNRADTAFIQLGFANNITAAIHVSWLNPLKQREVVITGEEQMMIFDDVHPTEKIRIIKRGREYHTSAKDFGSFQISIKDGDIIIPNVPYPEPLSEMLIHFVDRIRKKDNNKKAKKASLEVLASLELIRSGLKRPSLHK
jgi:predicted dehydrogenase